MSIGPSMPLRLEKPEGIDLAQAARYFGARGGADAATQALLEKCAVPLLAAATPRAVWLEADPDSLTAAGILAGEDVAKHLEGCTAALLLAVTLGPGVDAQIRRAGVGDIAAGVASDALGSALAEQAAEAAEAELRQWAARQGKYLTGRYSPGYGDWPLAVQPLLAAALDTARRILMLEGVQDPGNVGTLLRSAAAFGFDAVVLGPGCASPLSPKTLRSSMGAAGRLPTLHSADLPAALAQLESLVREKG